MFLYKDSANVFKAQAAYGRGWKNLYSHLMFFFFILRRLEAIKPKLIYACDLDTLIPSLIWRMNKKVVVVFDQFDPLSSRIRNGILALLIEKLEIFLAKESDIKITANKLRVPENSRDDWLELKNAFMFKSELKTSEEEKPPFILFYGGILAADRGLLSCAAAVSHHPDWELHIYGQGSTLDLLINHHYRNVFLHKPVPHEQLMQLAKKSDLLLAMYDPSRSNNRFTASNKLFEAAQLGRPLLTSRNTHLGEIVEGHGLGWAIEYDNVTEISRILAEYRNLEHVKKTDIQENLENFSAREYLDKQETINRLSRAIARELEV